MYTIRAFVCSRIDYCNSLLIGLSPLQTVLNAAAQLIAIDFPVTPISPHTSKNISIGFQYLLALNRKFSLLSLRSNLGWHINISVTPSDFRPLPHPFVLYTLPGQAGALCPSSRTIGQPAMAMSTSFSVIGPSL